VLTLLKVRVPVPSLVIPPVRPEPKSWIRDEIATVALLETLIVPLPKRDRVKGLLAPSANVTVPEEALSVMDQAAAVLAVLPFALPRTNVLPAAADPFVIVVVFVLLKPSRKVIPVEYKVTAVIVILVGATVLFVPAPAKVNV
jgi:hypothetical protein